MLIELVELEELVTLAALDAVLDVTLAELKLVAPVVEALDEAAELLALPPVELMLTDPVFALLLEPTPAEPEVVLPPLPPVS